MKKHIFGVALFSLIVASFALIFAFFFSPSIPPKEAVKPPVSKTETREAKPTSCFPKKMRPVSYTVVSSSFLAEQSVLKSVLTLRWNGSGEPPKKISIEPRFFTNENYANATVLNAETIIEPFKDGNSKIVNLETKVLLQNPGRTVPNFYVLFDVTDRENGTILTDERNGLGEAYQVLYVHPDNIKPVIRGRSIP